MKEIEENMKERIIRKGENKEIKNKAKRKWK